MKIRNFASSSAGNCYWVKFENSASILLEAGISLKDIKKKLSKYGSTLADIQSILVTHQHKDHNLATYKLIREENKQVWGNYTLDEKINLLEPFKAKWISSKLKVMPFKVEHDVESLGFIIKSADEKEVLLFVNDCKFFKADVSKIPFTYIMIECNYTAKVVNELSRQADLKNDYQKQAQYHRLLNAHMSDRNCLETLKKMNLSKCKGIYLMHLSDGHSNEDDYIERFKEELKVPIFSCQKYGGFYDGNIRFN